MTLKTRRGQFGDFLIRCRFAGVFEISRSLFALDFFPITVTRYSEEGHSIKPMSYGLAGYLPFGRGQNPSKAQ